MSRAERARVVCLHTSPAALGPVSAFYKQSAADLEVTNLLDDGLLPLLAAGKHDVVERRLRDLLDGARVTYGAQAALLTCSSLTKPTLAALRAGAPIPIVKIDEGMARAAVARGGTVGVLATFGATLAPTRALLEESAAEAGTTVQLRDELAEGAYAALLAGDTRAHDEAVAAAARRLATGVDVLVLAQVSMARVLPLLEGALGVPVLASLQTSLADVRAALRSSGVQVEEGG